MWVEKFISCLFQLQWVMAPIKIPSGSHSRFIRVNFLCWLHQRREHFFSTFFFYFYPLSARKMRIENIMKYRSQKTLKKLYDCEEKQVEWIYGNKNKYFTANIFCDKIYDRQLRNNSMRLEWNVHYISWAFFDDFKSFSFRVDRELFFMGQR